MLRLRRKGGLGRTRTVYIARNDDIEHVKHTLTWLSETVVLSHDRSWKKFIVLYILLSFPDLPMSSMENVNVTVLVHPEDPG